MAEVQPHAQAGSLRAGCPGQHPGGFFNHSKMAKYLSLNSIQLSSQLKKVFCSSDGIYVSVWYNDDTNLEGVASTPQDRAALNSLQKWAKKKNTWNSAQWNLKSWAGTTLCTRAGWELSGWNVAVLKKAWEPWKAIGMWLIRVPLSRSGHQHHELH